LIYDDRSKREESVNQDRNEAAQEFMEEIVDDLGYSPKGGKNRGPGSTDILKSAQRFLIPAGIVILVLIAVIVFFLMDRSGDKTDELASIQAKLNRLDERMAGLTRLEERIARLTRLEERIARLEALKGLKELGELENRINRLEREEKRLQQEIQKTSSSAVSASPKKPSSAVKEKYHTVRAGESLYTIAKKYSISLDKLCTLNKITPKKQLQPGQKLLVGG
jgi:LysM repeat protein